MEYPFYLIDAFVADTDPPNQFSGNPAGVCLLPETKSADWMQAVAAEINQAETAFLVPQAPGVWQLRWFTPKVEVSLCGHATLAAAQAIWQHQSDAASTLAFDTLSGRLTASREGELIHLDFPADKPLAAEVPAALQQGLGYPPVWYGKGRDDELLVLGSARAVREFQADDALIASFTRRGLIVTAPGDQPEVDMVSRFFAPKAGISEDSVTGAAHCVLAVYWGERLGKTRLRAFQASARTGLLDLEWRGERVRLGGRAKTQLAGVLYD